MLNHLLHVIVFAARRGTSAEALVKKYWIVPGLWTNGLPIIAFISGTCDLRQRPQYLGVIEMTIGYMLWVYRNAAADIPGSAYENTHTIIGAEGVHGYNDNFSTAEKLGRLLSRWEKKRDSLRKKPAAATEYLDSKIVDVEQRSSNDGGTVAQITQTPDAAPTDATAAVDAADDEEMVKVMDSMHGGQLGAWADGRALWPQADSGQ